MTEQIHQFGGTDSQMVGIYSPPQRFDKNRPAILFWNVGINHRVGPQRQFVDLSRKLALKGFPAFRFDISGHGDSPSSQGGLSGEDQEIADVQVAMDYLQASLGVRKFILVGYCSSAASAHPTALKDERVKGLVMIDGHGYRTRRYWLHHAFNSLRRLGFYKGLFLRCLKLFKPKPDMLEESFFRGFDSREKIEDEIQTLVDRGVKMNYIYTSGITDYYNYKNQFYDMFPRLNPKNEIVLDYYGNADHLFTSIQAKEIYQHRIGQWLMQHFGG